MTIEHHRSCTSMLVALALAAASGCSAAEDFSEEPIGTAEDPIINVGGQYDDGPYIPNYPPTQCNGMHCCPDGYAMRGMNAAYNRFRCVKIMEWYEQGSCFVDSTTVRVGMKACPAGHYMRGFHQAGNRMTCCPYRESDRALTAFIDGNSLRTWIPDYDPHWDYEEAANEESTTLQVWPFGTVKIHTCPPIVPLGEELAVMEGIHIANNDFLCGR